MSESNGLLSDRANRNAEDKIAYAIRQSFYGKAHLHEDFAKYLSCAKTCHLLDFSNANFNKAISLNPASCHTEGNARSISNPFANSKFELVKVASVCKISRGRVISHKYIDENKGGYPVYSSQTKDEGIMGYINTYDFEGEYITWTTDGIYAGTCFYRNGKFNCTNVCGTLKIIDNNKILYKFLVQVLNLATPNYVVRVANPKLMNNVMAGVKIPIPPLEIQKQIVAEYEKVEEQYKTIRMSIEEYQNLIKAILVKCGICEEVDLENIDEAILLILKSLENLESKLDFTFLETLSALSLRGSEMTEAIHKQSTSSSNNALPRFDKSNLVMTEANSTFTMSDEKDLKDLSTLLESLPTPPAQGWERKNLAKFAKFLLAEHLLEIITHILMVIIYGFLLLK